MKTEPNALWDSMLSSRYGDRLNVVDKRSSLWWRDLNRSLRFSRSGDEGWFDGNLRKVVGDDRDRTVADMISDINGEKKILWSWRRNLFRWEEELAEVCEGVVFGAERGSGGSDIWKWGDSDFSVKEAYLRLSEEEEEEVEWAKDVWNPLIPAKISILVWRLLYDRLPTKDNLRLRGVNLNSSFLCVGGCWGVRGSSGETMGSMLQDLKE
ncbi:putative non-LTR retroelement reverse transcriptase, partial [Trifolium medium]|nr:putative non-LTR retroelement reverse transcriptase [Trifolium medium]